MTLQTQHQQLLVEIALASLEATDIEFAPWYMVPADDKRRARLNCIIHMLSLFPEPEHDLGKRKKRKGTPTGPQFAHVVPQRF